MPWKSIQQEEEENDEEEEATVGLTTAEKVCVVAAGWYFHIRNIKQPWMPFPP